MRAGVVTPEAVLLELPTAGVATRSFSRLVDLAVQAALLTAMWMFIGLTGGPESLMVIAAIASGFVVLIVYPIGLEILWRGRSVGKWVFGLRVVGVATGG